MPYLDTIRFEGRLAGHGRSADVGFDVRIDDDGKLDVRLDRLPFARATLDLHRQQAPGDAMDLITLSGESGTGWNFHSDSFSITHFGHGSEPGRELEFQGSCGLAELSRATDKEASRSRRLWFVRQLRAVHALRAETPLGQVIAGGPHDLARDSQQPSGAIQITHPGGEADEAWWEETERFMIHLARVMSFGCGSYLLPVMEQRVDRDRLVWRVVKRGRAPAPFLAPFSELCLEPVFRRACESYPVLADQVELLDPAIRWLTAPVAMWEQHLVNAMTALEAILDRTAPEGKRLFLTGTGFKKLCKKLKTLLKDESAPAGMVDKLLELNRRPFKEQLDALLEHRQIVTADLPEGWLDEVLKSRNHIVHTGVAPVTEDESSVTLDQIVWPREIVIRLTLERIGFEGPYNSWLHKDEMLHFPSCEPMAQWAASRGPAQPGDD